MERTGGEPDVVRDKKTGESPAERSNSCTGQPRREVRERSQALRFQDLRPRSLVNSRSLSGSTSTEGESHIDQSEAHVGQRRGGTGRTPGGRVFRVLRFSLADGKILTVDVIADPARLREFDLAVLDE